MAEPGWVSLGLGIIFLLSFSFKFGQIWSNGSHSNLGGQR